MAVDTRSRGSKFKSHRNFEYLLVFLFNNVNLTNFYFELEKLKMHGKLIVRNLTAVVRLEIICACYVTCYLF